MIGKLLRGRDFLPGEVGQETYKHYRDRAKKIIHFIDDFPKRLTETCEDCNKLARQDHFIEVYEDPRDKEGRMIYFCSEACYQSFMYDPPMFYCEVCDRDIANVSLGYPNLVHYCGNEYCWCCFEKLILTGGYFKNYFEGYPLDPYFSIDDPKLVEAGFTQVISRVLAESKQACKILRGVAWDLIDSGKQVMLAYDYIDDHKQEIILLVKKEQEKCR
jgi:hypothetical protein